MLSSKQLRKKARIEAKKIVACACTKNENFGGAVSVAYSNINNVVNNSADLNVDINESENTFDASVSVSNVNDVVMNSSVDFENDFNASESREFFENSFDSVDFVVLGENKVEICLTEKLGRWAIKNNISNSALDELLKVLNENDINVPKDSRTVTKTPANVEQKKLGEGIYVHYGVKSALTDVLEVTNIECDDLLLDFNVDGLPLYKSSSKQVWPILGSIVNTSCVFLVGVFEGNSKPHSAEEYLKELIDELIYLNEYGMVFGDRLFNVKVRLFTMDAPARSFVLGTKGHCGYYSCVRCTDKGEMVKNRVVYPPNDAVILRNNQSFRSRSHPEHHNVRSITALDRLPDFDMVGQISLDYMHIVCLGVMRTLLNAWLKKKGENFSLTSWKIKELNNSLLSNRKNIPRDFNRKPRDLQELDRWKATELRQFLLYTGPCILNNILTQERYNNFLKLSLEVRILLNNKDCQTNNKCAENLLKSFVFEIPNLYDLSFLTTNFHCLLHLHEDVRAFGSLEGTSAFKFENHLQLIKKKVKKSTGIAAQIYKRQVEISFSLKKEEAKDNFVFGKIVDDGIVSVKSNNYYFSLESRDSYCLVSNNIVTITKILNVLVQGSMPQKILNALITLTNEVKELKQKSAKVIKRLTEEVVTLKMEVRKGSQMNGDNFVESNLPALPLQQIKDVEKLDADLHNAAACSQDFRHFLNRIGGLDGASFIRGAIRKIFVDELAAKYSWKGTKEKPSAELCYCISLLKDVCHMKFKMEDSAMNRILQQHFVHATDWMKKRAGKENEDATDKMKKPAGGPPAKKQKENEAPNSIK